MPATQKQKRRRALGETPPDKHVLYQRSVQSVEPEIDFVDRTYLKLRGKRASLLREDFCGTANTSCEWVRRRATNHAVGVDLDAATLAWGITHNLGALSEEERTRVTLERRDVLAARKQTGTRGYDCVLAMNFSYWCFKQRAQMLGYFKAVRASLAPGGVFFLDFYGGSDAHQVMKERRRIPAAGKAEPGFTYVWDQATYNPVTGAMTCYISFDLRDGTKMERAFRYEWRLWNLPELRDVLAEAGLRSTVYTEGDDGKGGGNGVFRPSEHNDADRAFICYIVAERS
ncbi:MAG: class I SAM-dependent methyltransferase [Phycisphaerales bacterium]|nr:class I SAM-dependent methyltransferase [Phycisphaerales bacterium]